MTLVGRRRRAAARPRARRARVRAARRARRRSTSGRPWSPCPSHREGFGVVCAEAMAYGRPVVVASAVGGLLDLVVDGETGLLVPPRDVRALRAALERLLGDARAAPAGMGEAGRERVREHFTWPAVTDATIAGLRGRAGRLRPAVVLGLLWAGLSIARSLGRRGRAGDRDHAAPARVRRCARATCASVSRADGDEAVLEAPAQRTRRATSSRCCFPERDEHVELVLRHWDEVRELVRRCRCPTIPTSRVRLRRKGRCRRRPSAAGVDAPRTVAAELDRDAAPLDLRPPFLLKPVEGQHFAGSFGEKVLGRADARRAGRRLEAREASAASTRSSRSSSRTRTSTDLVAVRLHRPRRRAARDASTGGKVRQGPLRFGTSAVFRTTPRAARARARAAAARDAPATRASRTSSSRTTARDGDYKLLEVNTRAPMWAGIAMSPRASTSPRIAYDDLCGTPEPEPVDLQQRASAWRFLAKDVWVSLQMARRRELTPARVPAPLPPAAQGARPSSRRTTRCPALGVPRLRCARRSSDADRARSTRRASRRPTTTRSPRRSPAAATTSRS